MAHTVIQDHSPLHSMFEANFDYAIPCLKTTGKLQCKSSIKETQSHITHT